MNKPWTAVLAAPVAIACGVALAVTASASSSGVGRERRPGASLTAATTLARLTLPPPTGHFRVGTVSLHLIDRSRGNPWTASPPYRELMVSVWYPARDVRRYPVAPHMLPGAAAHFDSPANTGFAGASLYGVPPGKVDWAATRTSGHTGAPLAHHTRPLPVVLYSPGAGDPRTWETTLVQDLASRGFIVVTIDHPYDASEVEFPGGRVVGNLWPQWVQQAEQDNSFFPLVHKLLSVTIADTRFVLDELTAIDLGRNPDAEQRPLPHGLAGALDLTHVGMLGVSEGGIAAPQLMYEDPRIKAGVDVDGTLESPLIPNAISLWPVAKHGLNRPFMFMGDAATDHNSVPSLKMLWTNSRGWHVNLHLKNAKGENSYKDAVPLIPQIARQLGLPDSYVTQVIGNVNPAGATASTEAYVSAFFDRWLRGHDDHLLDGPSPRYPDMAFVR